MVQCELDLQRATDVDKRKQAKPRQYRILVGQRQPSRVPVSILQKIHCNRSRNYEGIQTRIAAAVSYLQNERILKVLSMLDSSKRQDGIAERLTTAVSHVPNNRLVVGERHGEVAGNGRVVVERPLPVLLNACAVAVI